MTQFWVSYVILLLVFAAMVMFVMPNIHHTIGVMTMAVLAGHWARRWKVKTALVCLGGALYALTPALPDFGWFSYVLALASLATLGFGIGASASECKRKMVLACAAAFLCTIGYFFIAVLWSELKGP